ncbi:hypothetical protein KAJ87_00035 [Candidatus Pacearchaeota archaeon]|nr:hypothetical protein [Candidatus Pacearchaeota archaeon]
MSVTDTLLSNLDGVPSESYVQVKLPSNEKKKAKIVHSFQKRVILFQDDHCGDVYKKGLLKDSNYELYWVEWLNKKNEKVKSRYHINDLTGLLIRQ